MHQNTKGNPAKKKKKKKRLTGAVIPVMEERDVPSSTKTLQEL
jgi:hypothetical protein